MLTVNQAENRYLVSFANVSIFNVLNSKEVEAKLRPIISQQESKLTLSFTGVDFIDSSGLEVLINLYKESKRSNSGFNLINISNNLKDLMKLVELDQFFNLN
ncbi:MAG TPA: STAS domain-containing protein [Bacteroidales bacterium]|nr:STAS domain-containing protein [Bacteroidales bacterium]